MGGELRPECVGDGGRVIRAGDAEPERRRRAVEWEGCVAEPGDQRGKQNGGACGRRAVGAATRELRDEGEEPEGGHGGEERAGREQQAGAGVFPGERRPARGERRVDDREAERDVREWEERDGEREEQSGARRGEAEGNAGGGEAEGPVGGVEGESRRDPPGGDTDEHAREQAPGGNSGDGGEGGSPRLGAARLLAAEALRQ